MKGISSASSEKFLLLSGRAFLDRLLISSNMSDLSPGKHAAFYRQSQLFAINKKGSRLFAQEKDTAHREAIWELSASVPVTF
jgi:hypothetical protein